MKKATLIPLIPARLEAAGLRFAAGQVAADANDPIPIPTPPAPTPGVISVTVANIDTALQLGPR